MASNKQQMTKVNHIKIQKKILQIWKIKKMASDLHRTAQPHTFAAFPPWRSLQELVV